MADYPSNSNKSKTAEEKPVDKRVECVVETPVKTRKRSIFKDAINTIVHEDIPDFVAKNLIPSTKRFVYDLAITSVASILHIDNVQTRGVNAHVSYRDYYTNSTKQAQPNRYAASGYNFDDIVFTDRGTAESVLDRMNEALDRYGMVRVADLYGLAGISCSYTDNAYGWTDLRFAKVRPVNDGWIIDFPRAVPIK